MFFAMYSLDQKIKVCASCHGWGIDSSGHMCSQCQGREVYASDEGQVFVFDIPMYIDYGLRKKISLIRSGVLFSLVTLSVLTFIFLLFMLYQIFSS